MEALAKKGVLLLLSDSTNIEKPGTSPSEKEVYPVLLKSIQESQGLTFVTCFASNLGRVKQLLQIARETGKTVSILGKSLHRTLAIARESQLIPPTEDLIIPVEALKADLRQNILVISTGCQGEARSALKSISLNQYKALQLKVGDRVIFSSKVIPGNEKKIFTLYNDLSILGAEIITIRDQLVHTSGHAYREELIRMIQLVQPKFFIPLHGEFLHLEKHARLAEDTGIPGNHIMTLLNGQLVGLNADQIKSISTIPQEKNYIEIAKHHQRLDIRHIPANIISERRRLAANGSISVTVVTQKNKAGHQLINTRISYKGVYLLQDEQKSAPQDVQKMIQNCLDNQEKNYLPENLEEELRIVVGRYYKRKLDKKPYLVIHCIELPAGKGF